jgi:hypothetical protein
MLHSSPISRITNSAKSNETSKKQAQKETPTTERIPEGVGERLWQERPSVTYANKHSNQVTASKLITSSQVTHTHP